MSTDLADDFLAHYGVPGMKWGKRKGRDSSGSNRSSSAKPNVVSGSAVTKKQLDDEMTELGITTKPMKDLYIKGSNRADQLIEQTGAQPKERKTLTRGQKYAIAGGAVVIVGLAIYGGYKYQDIATRNAQGGDRISVKNFQANSSMSSMSFGYGTISKQKFSAMDTKDVTLPKTTVFKRVTADPKEDMSGLVYTAYTKADVDRYAGLFGPIVRKRSDSNKLYSSAIEVSTQVKSPSEKGRIQILIDLVNDDAGLRKKFISEHSSNSYTDAKLSAEELVLKSYGSFARQLVSQDDAVAKAYIDKVKRMGYNALIDDNNAKQIADAPIILLGAEKLISQVNSSELTKSIERAARRRLTEVMR